MPSSTDFQMKMQEQNGWHAVDVWDWMIPSTGGCRGYWGQFQLTLWAKARVHTGWLASSSQDPYWRQRLPHKVPTNFGAILGFSILLKDTLTCSSFPPQGSQDSNQQPSNHWSISSTHWATATPRNISVSLFSFLYRCTISFHWPPAEVHLQLA